MASPSDNGATIVYCGEFDRWFVHDRSGKAVAFRKSREEAEKAAASLPPPSPPRVRNVPPQVANLPTVHRELRPGFFDRKPTVRILRRPSRGSR
jgi:hypothetical protein